MQTAAPDAPTILALASYFKGERFLKRVADEGARAVLLTVESLREKDWPRDHISELFAVPDFRNRTHLSYTVAYLMRTRQIDRIVALDDFDVEVAAHLREHFRIPGMGDTVARNFRDKLTMRERARELGVRIPRFCAIVNHDAVRQFLSDVPGPWLMKPRGEASGAGIRKFHSADDIWRRIDELGDHQSFHLLEEMVPGKLFHVDSLAFRGELVFTEVNAYWKPLLDVYQAGGVYATRTLRRDHPDAARLRTLNGQVVLGFGQVSGASHTEFMLADRDGEFYFIETACRVGGAEIATMVEHAAGVNLWSEWAAIELAEANRTPYAVPPSVTKYAGVTISLANCEWPDLSAWAEPEIVDRLKLAHHAGAVVASDSAERVEAVLGTCVERIARQFHASLPAPETLH